MLRADIDALPQTEQYESPWQSLTPGVMHACGHDFHTASLLGAALLLARTEEQGERRSRVSAGGGGDDRSQDADRRRAV